MRSCPSKAEERAWAHTQAHPMASRASSVPRCCLWARTQAMLTLGHTQMSKGQGELGAAQGGCGTQRGQAEGGAGRASPGLGTRSGLGQGQASLPVGGRRQQHTRLLECSCHHNRTGGCRLTSTYFVPSTSCGLFTSPSHNNPMKRTLLITFIFQMRKRRPKNTWKQDDTASGKMRFGLSGPSP